MEQSGSALLRSLLNAFYNATDPAAFLASAGAVLNARLTLILPGQNSVSINTDRHNSVEIVSEDIIVDGKYIATLISDGNANPEKMLEQITSLLIKGVTLHNWFPFAFSERPDEFLRKCNTNAGELLCLHILEDMSKRAVVEACMRLSSEFSALHSFIESDGFTLLLKIGHQDDTELIEALSRELTLLGFRAGLSGPFKNVGLALNCMEKAKEAALSQCDNDDEPITFAAKARWHMFCKSVTSGLGYGGFCIADFLLYALKRILSYDAQNGTQYYESIYHYLLYGKNLKPAAQALLIHRNTLAYRVGRISELFDIDFEDRHVCFELLFSCKLYEETVSRK